MKCKRKPNHKKDSDRERPGANLNVMGWHSGRIILLMLAIIFIFQDISLWRYRSSIFGKHESHNFLIFEFGTNWNDLCRKL